MTRRAWKGAWATLVSVVLVASGLVASSGPATAQTPVATAGVASASTADMGIVKTADLSQFRPGNIIADSVFFDSATMTEAQIQSFLESKVAVCRAGFTCLKDYYVDTRAIAADPMCAAYPGGSRERASTVIFKVAQACGINPQVILVMLQKEQGLITSTAPSAWAYQAAMGQGCPDTAACDARYYGLFNQVYGGAWQMKRYANPPGTSRFFTWYAPGNTWNVLFHPNAACGRSPVLIENQATANLYYYTPYQPNPAALAAGYGLGDGCSSYGNRNFFNYFTDWFGSTQGTANNPFGNIEILESQFGGFRVRGWAIDPNTNDPIEIHIYVGQVGYARVANQDRPDVGAAYPGKGSLHGFDVTVPATGPGTVTVCVYGINVGSGWNSTFACVPLPSRAGPPFGALESATGVEGGVDVSGWAIDPDSGGPIEVHAYVGSVGVPLVANVSRPDVGQAHPPYGNDHGFRGFVPASPGVQRVCAYALNVGVGSTTTLGCVSVTVPGEPDLGRAPVGNFESLAVTGGTVTAAGWAIDPDTAKPIAVHLYVNGAGREVIANKSRPDVGAVFPAAGPLHGFSEQLTLPPGTSEVCAYGINAGVGTNSFLGCRKVTVGSPDQGRAPVGNFESLTVSGASATATGWALDPDTSSPIAVHLYVNGVGREYVANRARPDVGAAFPGLGSDHGFTEQVALLPGRNQVCAYGINNGAGANSFLGCRTVTVASTPAGVPPLGFFESVTPTAGGAVVTGWTFDRDTTAPIEVHIYVGAAGYARVADKSRPDVAAAFSVSGNHGFVETLPIASGTHRICAYGINVAGGDNALLGCRMVTIP